MLAHPSSFRDPSGYVVEKNGEIFRLIHPDAQKNFKSYIDSGLHQELASNGLIVSHEDLGLNYGNAPVGWQTLKIEKIERISYASEWCFSQLRDAALITLDIQIRALAKGFSLKDASSYNTQFNGTKPIFIDTLSFDPSNGNDPWIAYRQFCEHFLAPLALMAYRNSEITKLWNSQIDGIPVNLASALLPKRTWFNFGLLAHIHLHALSESNKKGSIGKSAPQTRQLLGFQKNLAYSLKKIIIKLPKSSNKSHWSEYRKNNTYKNSDAKTKLAFIQKVAEEIHVKTVLDLGSNDGHYSKELSNLGLRCTAVENDLECCEVLYEQSKKEPTLQSLLGLHLNLCNPTPNYGWASTERSSFTERFKSDLVLALALVHHLSIGQNVPYDKIANYLSSLSKNLIVEYIPPTDIMSQRLLASRPAFLKQAEKYFGQASFEESFTKYFSITKKSEIIANGRVLYLMVSK